MNMLQMIAKALQSEGVPKELCNKAAKAAILAMREPTDDMANEYYRLRKECGDIDATACFNVSVWETMIDAALKE